MPILFTNGNTTSFITWGNAATTGNSGALGYYYTGDNNLANKIQLAFLGGGGGNFTIPNKVADPTSPTTYNQSTTTLNTYFGAVPRWGGGYIVSNQTIPITVGALLSWTTTTSGPLTRTATRFTNTGLGDIFVQVSFMIPWESLSATFSSVFVSVRKNGGQHFALTRGIADGSVTEVVAATTIVPMINTDYFEIEAAPTTGGVDRVVQGNILNSFTSYGQMTYYILN